MKTSILYGVEGAKQAKGLVIVVDIYRAATVAAYALHHGAKHIIPVATIEEAFMLKTNNPDFLLMGEEHGIIVDGFDFGNSPFAMTKNDIKGKVLVQRTSAGTQGLAHARQADEVIFGSFPTAHAIVTYIHRSKPSLVSIVAMDGPDTEDEWFSSYLIDVLGGKKPDVDTIKKQILSHHRSAHFFDPSKPHFPEPDVHLALSIGIFNFVCLLVRDKDGYRLMKQSV